MDFGGVAFAFIDCSFWFASRRCGGFAYNVVLCSCPECKIAYSIVSTLFVNMILSEMIQGVRRMNMLLPTLNTHFESLENSPGLMRLYTLLGPGRV